MPAVSFNGQWITREETQQKIREAAIRTTFCVRRAGKQENIKVVDPKDLVGENKRVSVVRNMGLGDVLLITPMVRALHERLKVKVDVLTNAEYVPVFRDNPHVSRVGVIDSPNYHVWQSESDAVIDLREYAENPVFQQQNRARCFMESAGFYDSSDDEIRLNYYVHDMETAWARSTVAKEFGESLDLRKLVGYVWRASTAQRSWSTETHRAHLAAISKAGFSVIVFDHMSQDVPYLTNVYDGTAKYSIRETAALMSLCGVVITPDTGTFHLAQALGVKTFAYFGAFPLEDRQTYKRGLALLNKDNHDCEYRPCRVYSCANQDENGQSMCLRVDSDVIVKALKYTIKDK